LAEGNTVKEDAWKRWRPRKRKSIAERMQKRLKEELGLNVGDKLTRTRAGYWQKSSGAWAWYMAIVDDNGKVLIADGIGSQVPATELLKAKKWELYSNGGGLHVEIDELPDGSLSAKEAEKL
jgi:hypothetical protein